MAAKGPASTSKAYRPARRPRLAVWFIASTGREVFQSHEELIWPEKIVCGHADHYDAAVTAN
jgi:hypothetical protein